MRLGLSAPLVTCLGAALSEKPITGATSIPKPSQIAARRAEPSLPRQRLRLRTRPLPPQTAAFSREPVEVWRATCAACHATSDAANRNSLADLTRQHARATGHTEPPLHATFLVPHASGRHSHMRLTIKRMTA